MMTTEETTKRITFHTSRALLIGSLLLAGCATLANTPAQERTWERIRACGGASATIHVRPDGGWRATGDQASVYALVECMRQYGPAYKG